MKYRYSEQLKNLTAREMKDWFGLYQESARVNLFAGDPAESLLPTEELGQINDYMGSIRPVVKTRIETEKLRRQVYQTILARLLAEKKTSLLPEELEQIREFENYLLWKKRNHTKKNAADRK